MKLTEYYISKDKADKLIDATAHRFNKFCNKRTCSDCKYVESRDCFLEYLKDNDVEV